MLMKRYGLVFFFFFIVRLRFPSSQSLVDVIRKRYGDKALRLRQLIFEYIRIKQEQQYQLSPIAFMHVSLLFLVSNDKAIRRNDKIHGRKLQKLIPNIHEKSIIDNVSHDPNKVIYNFSNYHLTDSDKSLLIKGLNFAIPPKKIEYSKFLLPFELLFRDIKSNSESSVDLASVKARLQDTAFTSYSAFNKDNSPPSNLSENEFESQCKLKNENNLVIQKADKGNTFVILDKADSSLPLVLFKCNISGYHMMFYRII